MKPVKQLITEAQSVDECRQVINYMNWTRPYGKERRRLLKLARLKIQELRCGRG